MYHVLKNNRSVKAINNQAWDGAFKSYEQARQALRRYIRALVKAGKASRDDFFGTHGWDNVSRNPVTYTNAGFSIRKVA